MMYLRLFSVLAILTGTASPFFGQAGDRSDADRSAPPADLEIPPAPVLTPDEALKSFTLAPGFRIELVASEPLIQDPVALDFDADGRIWVVEMRGFMPNPDGVGEDEPVGQVVLLEDTTGDGKMDKSTVFLDGLVMPRAIAVVGDGVLVAEPPYVWFARDTTGDGRADEKTAIDDNYGNQSNPEHNANGLIWSLDNWIYNARHTTRFRFKNGEWESDRTIFRGQWGLTQDDYGRHFYNTNSDQLRGDLVPSHYLGRNPNFRGAGGTNVRIANQQAVWPIRVTPGINRINQLRDNWKVRNFTAACGPVIYRGDIYPDEFYGDAFVMEPAANLIKRNVLIEQDGVIRAEHAYEESEFLASTDERFRPVNAYTAPDGSLYILDMYRGILQHRIYLTTFLRNQIEDRGLDKPLGLGRIYRIVHESGEPGLAPTMSKESPLEWVQHLNHSNGWWRDTAQRLLVETNDPVTVRPLRELAISGKSHLARLHALWTLDGIDGLDEATVLQALSDQNAKVRVAAVRLSEAWLQDSSSRIFAAVLEMREDPAADVRLQLAFSLGESGTPEAERAMAFLLYHHAQQPLLIDAAITGLHNRELEMLERFLSNEEYSLTNNVAPNGRVLRSLARAVFEEEDVARVDRVLKWISQEGEKPAWVRGLLLETLHSALPLELVERPENLLPLLEETWSDEERERLADVVEGFNWPGKSEDIEVLVARPLTEEEELRFEQGRNMYQMICAACHQIDGSGITALAPALKDSEYVLAPEGVLGRIILQGLERGGDYVAMPPLGGLGDEPIASVMTYLRRAWDHQEDPVDSEALGRIRQDTEGRDDAWTEKELRELME